MSEAALTAWIADSIRSLNGSKLVVDSHLDDVLKDKGRSWSPSEAVDVVVDAARVIEREWTGRLSLAIPLEVQGTALTVTVPALSTLEPRRAEPPSLYLFDSRYFLSNDLAGEEYRQNYDSNPWNLTADAWRVEFSSFRDRQAVDREWEPSNTIWVHFIGNR